MAKRRATREEEKGYYTPEKPVRKKSAKNSAAMNERMPRKEPYTSARMAGVLERIREQATRMSALARSLDDAKIDAIIVDGHAMLIRGLNQIENFLDNASRAVREAKSSRESETTGETT